MSLLGTGRHLAVADPDVHQPTLTDREAFLLGALLSLQVAEHADRYGGIDLIDPCALNDIRDQLRQRWLQRLGDGGGAEGARLRELGRGTR